MSANIITSVNLTEISLLETQMFSLHHFPWWLSMFSDLCPQSQACFQFCYPCAAQPSQPTPHLSHFPSPSSVCFSSEEAPEELCPSQRTECIIQGAITAGKCWISCTPELETFHPEPEPELNLSCHGQTHPGAVCISRLSCWTKHPAKQSQKSIYLIFRSCYNNLNKKCVSAEVILVAV